jgi:hypothetical protein
MCQATRLLLLHQAASKLLNKRSHSNRNNNHANIRAAGNISVKTINIMIVVVITTIVRVVSTATIHNNVDLRNNMHSNSQIMHTTNA